MHRLIEIYAHAGVFDPEQVRLSCSEPWRVQVMLVIDRTVREIFCRKLATKTFLKAPYAEVSTAP
jgi:hypothetical protein